MFLWNFATRTRRTLLCSLLTSLLCLTCFINLAVSQEVFTVDDLLKTRAVAEAEISPDGNTIAFTVSVPRNPDDPPGSVYRQLFLLSLASGEIRPFIVGEERITKIQWRPDGAEIAFLASRGKSEGIQVWTIPAAGGEARVVTNAGSKVTEFRWHPSSKKIAYVATAGKTAREKALQKKGYDFIYHEENLKHRNLYLTDLQSGQTEQLTNDITVWDFVFSPDGSAAAISASPQNLIDHSYMFKRVHLLDLQSKKSRLLVDNPGKLGNVAFSPDGSSLAYAAALERKDHQISQAFVVPVKGGAAKNLTPPNFRGHINWVGWKDNSTVAYTAHEGVNTTLSTVKISGTGADRKMVLGTAAAGFTFETPSYTSDFKKMAFVGQTGSHPGEVYFWKTGDAPRRLTTSNAWLAERKLGKQEAVRYAARDGVEVEGLLIYPVDYKKGNAYPMVFLVHGGPESNLTNRWLTRYSEPAQVLAGRGYAVFYPNYRSSTGYGLEFAAAGYGDAAGVEFDDIADGIDYFIREGIADKDRIGLGGGSYGGFASAWFATYYTKHVKAVCMFVGISDLISKRGTTDIAYEELYVHSGKPLEEMWQQSLERSPIYYAHQSKTAVLIYGGADDTRVHPSQSLELYSRLKMNNHPAVRLVQYPKEQHGNRMQPGQIDVVHRITDWYDWYVKDAKPLDGPMPPLDISERYGIDLPSTN